MKCLASRDASGMKKKKKKKKLLLLAKNRWLLTAAAGSMAWNSWILSLCYNFSVIMLKQP